MEVTHKQLLVLKVLFDNQSKAMSGYEIRKECSVGTSTVYSVLYKMLDSGLLRQTREQGDPTNLGRPLRVYYELSGEGKTTVRAQLNSYADLISGRLDAGLVL